MSQHSHTKKMKPAIKVLVLVGILLAIVLVFVVKQSTELQHIDHDHSLAEHDAHGVEGIVFHLVDTIGTLLESSLWLVPLLALLAGVLTSFTPCSLSSVPLLISYIDKAAKPGRATKLSLFFALGSALTFCSLGLLASWIGKIFEGGSWWFLVLGILMILMALQTWEVVQFIPSHIQMKSSKNGYLGAFVAGIFGGVFSSHCAAPVLIAMLAISATIGNPLFGALLLLLYSAGHSILAILAGISTGWIERISKNPRYQRLSDILRIILGSIIFGIALYLLYLAF